MVPFQEFGDREPLLALELDFAHGKITGASCNHQTHWSHFGQGSWRRRGMRNRPLTLGGKDLEELTMQSCVRRRPGSEGTNTSCERVGLLAPVDAAIFFLEQRRVSRGSLVLRLRHQLPTFHKLERFAQRLCTEYRELVVQRATGIVARDGNRLLQ